MTENIESELIGRVRAKIIEEGDCWIWQGRTNQDAMPRMDWNGRRDQMVRRVIVQDSGKTIPKGMVVSPTCDNRLCVCPKHMKVVTVREARGMAAKAGAYRNANRNRKAAMTLRARSHITEEVVAQIKAAGSSPEAARLTGVSVSYAWSIRAGLSRRNFANPFEGLMR